MVTPTKGARLGSSPAHERLILANLATSLYEHGKIKTTLTRAKRLRPVAEHIITIAKKGTLAARRQVMTTIRDKSIVHLLMTEIAEQFKDREGGYTRITKIERRKGDQSEMAIIELVSEPLVKAKSAKKDSAPKASDKDIDKVADQADEIKDTEEEIVNENAEETAEVTPEDSTEDTVEEATEDTTTDDDKN